MRWWQKQATLEASPVVYAPPVELAVAVPTIQSTTLAPDDGLARLSLSIIVENLELEAPRYPLEEQVEVAGETHHIKDIRRVYRDHDMPITAAGTTLDSLQCVLVPQQWNEHDPNAVAVLVGAHHVGYIPAELARDYSLPLLRLAASTGALATGVARIWAKDDGGMVRARVTLLLPEAAVFI